MPYIYKKQLNAKALINTKLLGIPFAIKWIQQFTSLNDNHYRNLMLQFLLKLHKQN